MRTPDSTQYHILQRADVALKYLRKPRTPDALAKRLGCHPRSALRLLVTLVTVGQAKRVRAPKRGVPSLYVGRNGRP